MNTSFSSVGSSEGIIGANINSGSSTLHDTAHVAVSAAMHASLATVVGSGAPSSATSSCASSSQTSATATTATASQSRQPAPSQSQPQPHSQSHAHTHSHNSTRNHHSNGNHAPNVSTPSQPKKHRSKSDSSGNHVQRPSATVGPAPTPAMHWTRAKVHGQIPPKDLRAQTVNLVGESVYVFGGCDSKTCYNTLYIFDAGNNLDFFSSFKVAPSS